MSQTFAEYLFESTGKCVADFQDPKDILPWRKAYDESKQPAGGDVVGMLRVQLQEEPSQSVIQEMVSVAGATVSAALQSGPAGATVLGKLYLQVRDRPSTRTIGLWAKEHLYLKGFTSDPSLLFRTGNFDTGAGMYSLLIKTLDENEAQSIKAFVSKIPFADDPQNVLPIVHPGLTPFSLLQRDGQLLQLMPPYPNVVEPMSGDFSPESASLLFDNVADCLTFLHKKCKFLHADIKPANIAIDQQGRAVLIDTGSLVPIGGRARSTWLFVPADLDKQLRGGGECYNAPVALDWWMLACTMRWLIDEKLATGIQPRSMELVKKDLSSHPTAGKFWPRLAILLEEHKFETAEHKTEEVPNVSPSILIEIVEPFNQLKRGQMIRKLNKVRSRNNTKSKSNQVAD